MSKTKTAAPTSNSRPQKKTKNLLGWKEVHERLNKCEGVAGVYGGVNSVYFGLAGIRAKVDMDKFHTNRSPDEYLLPPLEKLINLPETQARWDNICTLDPMGLTADRPTMAATTAIMNIEELNDLERDGVIVNADGGVNTQKCAIDYVWNVPKLSERLGMDEGDVRQELYKYTHQPEVKDPNNPIFLPPTGGATVYFFGDITKLSDKSTEVAVRVHDQCTGSDVFGTDICTCRPYLIFALRAAIECAQRGGVGVIVYYQKEGRSLGEVTKYRVYNARKGQDGGDCAEKYFYQTESIAGIRDARFQEMMPDVLVWLGIDRIDWLLSMSSEKYDAITGAGIKVMQRVSLPDVYVPANAHIEINAKVMSGYHTDQVNSDNVVSNLRQLSSIRSRCNKVFEYASTNENSHFKIDMSKMDDTVTLVVDTIKKNYPDLKVPYHSRWSHFRPGFVEKLTAQWHCDPVEKCRRLLDLSTVSVLLDAGAGNQWKYVDHDGETFSRSEGIAIATANMFLDGNFSSDPAFHHRVNAHGLLSLTEKEFERGFQIRSGNPMNGSKGRFKLLRRLAKALQSNPEFFGHELARPGNIVDYVLANATDLGEGKKSVSIHVLWKGIIEGLESIWPENLAGIRRGDMWVYNPLKVIGTAGSDLVPFHKLSQWLTLSLLEPIEDLGVTFTEIEALTGLAEYRNGGLFVDTGVLTLRDQEIKDNLFDVGSEVVVEWRALTIVLLDKISVLVRERLGLSEAEFPMMKVLQGGTWAAGRIIARQKRPDTLAPPVSIRSDGNVF